MTDTPIINQKSKIKNLKSRIIIPLMILLLVALDQWLKLYIHSHFELGEAYPITSWFWICYVENDGMAFGIEWFSKLLLTLFRIVAVGVLGWYMSRLLKPLQERSLTPREWGYIAMIILVIAGALGNIVDCLFYGIAFGYAPLFYGRVIDMLYFPLIHNASGEVLFFRPVFNLADSYITTAVIAILLFFRHQLNDSLNCKTDANA